MAGDSRLTEMYRDCFQESESTQFNSWVVAVLRSLNYLAIGKAGIPWILLTNRKILGLYQLSYIYLQAIATA